MEKNKLRDFEVDHSKDIIHEGLNMSFENGEELARRMALFTTDYMMGEKDILVIAQEIGETFTIKELVINTILFVKHRAEKQMRKLGKEINDHKNRKKEDDDDDELNFKGYM